MSLVPPSYPNLTLEKFLDLAINAFKDDKSFCYGYELPDTHNNACKVVKELRKRGYNAVVYRMYIGNDPIICIGLLDRRCFFLSLETELKFLHTFYKIMIFLVPIVLMFLMIYATSALREYSLR